MPVQVWMPQLGESVTEGTITKWLKAVGERVEEFEPLVEVNTDKVDTEIPSPATGTLLEIMIPEGTVVKTGAVLALISGGKEIVVPGPSGGQSAQDLAPAGTLPTKQAPAPKTITSGDRELGFISPVVRKIASEHQVDLYKVIGSGTGGRITKQDILSYIESHPTEPVKSAESLGTQPAPVVPLPAPVPQKTPAAPGAVFPLTPVRRLIAEHMVTSKHTSPHVTTIMEADLGRVISHRQANKEAFSQDGVNLTFTAYFISAASVALKAFPLVNSSWGEGGIVLHRSIYIGMAASMGEEGLIVPVIKNADTYSLLGLARIINDLASRARGHKLLPDEVKGGTFTITNHGTSGSLFATPIINQPQSAILGVGAIQKRPVVISLPDQGDTIAIRSMVYLGLTFDHRILDGAIADAFLGKIIETLQNWS
ncbi:MAG: hypothetical protein A2Z16_07840 [Chloroflexi bacterium RBG_16_54_18]|nr:MAG: hypothetical protein A2Z16_07840 [Chloroflexi bacterium RBG_16_54_18]